VVGERVGVRRHPRLIRTGQPHATRDVELNQGDHHPTLQHGAAAWWSHQRLNSARPTHARLQPEDPVARAEQGFEAIRYAR
jgi:hypothetical protein